MTWLTYTSATSAKRKQLHQSALSHIILLSIIVAAILPTIVSSCDSESIIANKMEAAGIVPSIIDVAPAEEAQIIYPSGVSVNMGNELTPTQVKDQPTVTWTADDMAYYTLIMTDPDAPSRADPSLGEVRHWYAGNIPGNRIADGEQLFEYRGSGPPKGTGLHRYIFLVFKQSAGKLVFDEPRVEKRSRQDRLKSSTKDFVAKYNLDNPVAGNFYQAQYDEYVDVLRAETIE